MEFMTESNGKGGLMFRISNPPAPGTELTTTEGEAVVFDEIGFAGMIACTRKVDGMQQLYFPHDLVIPVRTLDERLAKMKTVAEGLEAMLKANDVLHKVFFLGGGDMAEAAHALASVEAMCWEVRQVIGSSLVDLARVEIMAGEQAADREART